MTLKSHAAIPLALLCGCAPTTAAETMSAFLPLVGDASLSEAAPGIWMSDGYGYVLDSIDETKVYNFVGDFCQLIEADQESPMLYFDRLRLNDDGQELFLSSFTEPHEVKFDPSQPCQRPAKLQRQQMHSRSSTYSQTLMRSTTPSLRFMASTGLRRLRRRAQS